MLNTVVLLTHELQLLKALQVGSIITILLCLWIAQQESGTIQFTPYVLALRCVNVIIAGVSPQTHLRNPCHDITITLYEVNRGNANANTWIPQGTMNLMISIHEVMLCLFNNQHLACVDLIFI